MVRIAFDGQERCLLIHVLSGPKTEQDWENAIASFFLVDGEAVRQQKSGLAFVVVEDGAARPNATWRRRLAEQRPRYKSTERHLVLVTSSFLFRGVLNTVNLLSPPPPSEKIFVSGSLQEGIAKAESWRGEPLLFLRKLFPNKEHV